MIELTVVDLGTLTRGEYFIHNTNLYIVEHPAVDDFVPIRLMGFMSIGHIKHHRSDVISVMQSSCQVKALKYKVLEE